MNIGDEASLTTTITAQNVRLFAELSSDMNPIHLDPEYAKTTPFGKPIAHGLYVASFLSAVLANKLPGPGSIYLSQDLQFKKPVFFGDTITAKVEIAEMPKLRLIRLKTTCVNQDGVAVIEGSALVMKK